MIGMTTICNMRIAGVKPDAVFVQLVAEYSKELRFGTTGIVTVEIIPRDVLTDLDLRPLVGLPVCVEDFTGEPKRLRELAALVAKADAETLWMPSLRDDRLTLHIRRDKTTSETHDL